MKKALVLTVIITMGTLAGCGQGPSPTAELAGSGAEVTETIATATVNDLIEVSNSQEDLVMLEEIDFSQDTGLYEALETRVAANWFTDEAISFDVVSKILWAAHGVTYTEGMQTVHGLDSLSSATQVPRYTISPASYNRFIKIYYISKDGAYEYIPEDRAIKNITEDNLLSAGGSRVANAQFRILVTIDKDLHRGGSEWAYLTVGSSLQNINLVAGSEGVHVFTQGVFEKDPLAEALGIESNEEQAVLLSFGRIQ